MKLITSQQLEKLRAVANATTEAAREAAEASVQTAQAAAVPLEKL